MNRRTVTAAATAFALGLLGACGSSSGGNSGTSCTAGESTPCVGAGSCAGTQICEATGQGYGACTCHGADSGGTTVADSGTGFDSTVADTATSNVDTGLPADDTGTSTFDTGTGPEDSGSSDTGVVLTDTGVAASDTGGSSDGAAGSDTGTHLGDAATDTNTAGTCPDNTPFTAVTWAPPTALHQTACTAAEINAWVTSQNQTTGLGTSGNMACDQCISTPETASAHGPVVTATQGGVTVGVELNLGGCVADSDGSKAAGSCGNQINNEDDCFNQQCGDCADFTSMMQSPTGPTAECEQAIFSTGGACASDFISNTSACGMEATTDGGIDQACLSAATLQDFFTIWCGATPVTDAGHDGSTAEAGADGGLTCPPQSTAGFTTGAYVAATAHQGVCSASQINAFITACGDNGTESTCDAWQATNVAGGNDGGGAGTTCGNCVFAPHNNGGTWTDPDGFFEPNYGGCIQLTDSSHGTACATALDNLLGCNGVACDNACPANDTNSADFVACDNAADNGGSCATYGTAEVSACATDVADGGAFGTCSPGAASNTLDPDYQYILTLICGH